MDCRPGCGACCIAPSMTSPLPGLPDGKSAGMVCPQLTDTYRCVLFGQPGRPACCSGLQPEPVMCGADRVHALTWLAWLEAATRP